MTEKPPEDHADLVPMSRRLFKSLRRRKLGMIGDPPLARQVPADPSRHAADFGHR